MTMLLTQQQELADWLLHRVPGQAPAIMAADAEQRHARLRIYADGYRWRLIEVLGQDYPALRAVLGAEDFDALAERYLEQYPSQYPSVRHVGSRFHRWFEELPGIETPAAELARLEWMQGEVFDAADNQVCRIDDLAAMAPEHWPLIRLTLSSAVRHLQTTSNAVAMFDAYTQAQPLPALRTEAPGDWLLWRANFDVHWRRLPEDENQALAAVVCGEPFGAWCEQLSGDTPALRAAGLLKRWLADGLISEISTE